MASWRGESLGDGRFWEAHPEVAASFDELMGTPDGDVLLDPAGWESVRIVVDVGGGTGALLASVLRDRPAVRGILVDLPRTALKARELLAAAGVPIGSRLRRRASSIRSQPGPISICEKRSERLAGRGSKINSLALRRSRSSLRPRGHSQRGHAGSAAIPGPADVSSWLAGEAARLTSFDNWPPKPVWM
jgi:hypothetical protein